MPFWERWKSKPKNRKPQALNQQQKQRQCQLPDPVSRMLTRMVFVTIMMANVQEKAWVQETVMAKEEKVANDWVVARAYGMAADKACAMEVAEAREKRMVLVTVGACAMEAVPVAPKYQFNKELVSKQKY